MPFLGRQAGIGPGGIDKADDGQAKFIGQPHQAKRLAIALGMGETEVVADVLLGIVALLVADDDHLLAADFRQAADQRKVIAEATVAAQFREVGGDDLEVVERIGSRRMTHDLHPLPGRQAGVDARPFLLELGLKRLDLRGRVDNVFLELNL